MSTSWRLARTTTTIGLFASQQCRRLGSAWFKWVAPTGAGATRKLRVDASNAILDVRVYSDPAGTLAALTTVYEAAADTPGCMFSQRRTFTATRGQSYGDATQGSSGTFSAPWAAAA